MKIWTEIMEGIFDMWMWIVLVICRATEWQRLEGTSEDRLVQPPC